MIFKAIHLNKIVIFGVGLIGGSVALALKKTKAAPKIVGVGRQAQNLQAAMDLGVIDEAESDLAKALADADLVMIATPLVARFIGLNSPRNAMVFGGMMGTVSGVTAGLAATDRRLVPYGALTATFHTGLGCLLAPSALYFAVLMLTGGR